MKSFGKTFSAPRVRRPMRPSILMAIAGAAMLLPVNPFLATPMATSAVEAAQARDARLQARTQQRANASEQAPQQRGPAAARQRASREAAPAPTRPTPAAAPSAPRAASPAPAALQARQRAMRPSPQVTSPGNAALEARQRAMRQAPIVGPAAPSPAQLEARQRAMRPSPQVASPGNAVLEARQRAMRQAPIVGPPAPRAGNPAPSALEARQRAIGQMPHRITPQQRIDLPRASSPQASQPSRVRSYTAPPREGATRQPHPALEARQRATGQVPRQTETRRLPQPPSRAERQRPEIIQPTRPHPATGTPLGGSQIPRRDRAVERTWDRNSGDRGSGHRGSGDWTDRRGTPEYQTDHRDGRSWQRRSAEHREYGRDRSNWRGDRRGGYYHPPAPRPRTRLSINIGAHFGHSYWSPPPPYVASPFIFYSTAYRPYRSSVFWSPSYYHSYPYYYGYSHSYGYQPYYHYPRSSFSIGFSTGRHFRTNFSYLYHYRFGHVPPAYPVVHHTTLVRPAVVHVVHSSPIVLSQSTVASSGWFGGNEFRSAADDRVGVVLPEPRAEYLAVESEPLRVTTGADLGMTYLQLGDAESALRVLINHLTEYPNDTEAIRAISLAYMLLGEGENGVRQVGRAYRLSPWLAARPLPRNFLAPDDHAYALDVATHTATHLRSPDAWLTVAMLMQADGRHSAARAAIDRARETGLDRQVAERFLTALPAHDGE